LSNKKAKIQGLALDLGDFNSIDNCVKEFLKLDLPLHILINNAGVMATPEWKTKDGLEYQIGINHFGHFRLTNLLLPKMKETAEKSGEGRIVNVSSEAHTMGSKTLDFDDINLRNYNSYGTWKAYGQSKLANIIFSNELNLRLKNDKIPITACSLHPGVIQTELLRSYDSSVLKFLFFGFGLFFHEKY